MKFRVIRDSKEQEGHGWIFPPSKFCLGTTINNLPTADYTLEGYEELFVIERKGCVAEFYKNIFEQRFENELERLDLFKYPYIVLEFTLPQMLSFPYGSSIPKRFWGRLRGKGALMLRRIHEWEMRHKARYHFAGNKGKEMAQSLFKRIVEYGEENGKHEKA